MPLLFQNQLKKLKLHEFLAISGGSRIGGQKDIWNNSLRRVFSTIEKENTTRKTTKQIVRCVGKLMF